MFSRFFKGFLAFTIGSVFLFSCEPAPLDIDLPAHQPKLVISSQAVTGQGVVISVSKSFSSLNAPSDSLAKDSLFLAGIVVDHAYVSISAGGQTTILEKVGPGLYGSKNLPEMLNMPYTLYVKDSVSGLECSASTSLLPQVEFYQVQPTVKVAPADTTIQLAYSFLDPENARNYYLVSVVSARRNYARKHKKQFGLKKFEQEFFLLTDENRNGRFIAETQKLHVKPQDTIMVSLTNISPEYYRYLSLYQKSGSYYNQLTGEPINFPTNINNGYGFFNMTKPSAMPFLLREHWR